MRRIAQDDGVSLMQAKSVNELLNIYNPDPRLQIACPRLDRGSRTGPDRGSSVFAFFIPPSLSPLPPGERVV